MGELWKLLRHLIEKLRPKQITRGVDANKNNLGMSVIYREASNIPDYKELSPEEKSIVDQYIESIDISKADNLMEYATEIDKRREKAYKWFFMVLDRETEEQMQFDDRNITIKQIVDRAVTREKLQIHEQELKDLEKEITLRIIALEKFKKDKHFLNVSSIFGFARAELMKYNTEIFRLEESIERMKDRIQNLRSL